MSKVSLTVPPSPSLAVTFTVTVPAFAAGGVPEKVRVLAVKVSQFGSARAVALGRRVAQRVAGIGVGEGVLRELEAERRARFAYWSGIAFATVGTLLAATAMSNVSLTVPPLPSSAVTFTVTVTAVAGVVPEKVRVVA